MVKANSADFSEDQKENLKKAYDFLEEKSAFILVTSFRQSHREQLLTCLTNYFKASRLVIRVGKNNDESILQQIAPLINVSKKNNVSALTSEIYKKLTELTRKALLIFDNAEKYTIEELEIVRQLSNLPNTQKKGLSILLCGQPNLVAKLGRKRCSAINQRITGRISLEDNRRILFSPLFLKMAIPSSIFLLVCGLIIWQNYTKTDDSKEVAEKSSGLPYSEADLKREQLTHVFDTEQEAVASFKTSSDSVREEKIIVEELRKKTEAGVNWLLSQPDNAYTIQLFLLSDPISIIQDRQIVSQVEVVPVSVRGKKLFGVYSGSFSSSEAAKRSLTLLPPELLGSKPFPQKIAIIKAQKVSSSK